MKEFEVLDISGDAGIRACGRSLSELFMHAGTGMYSLMTDLKDISEKKTISVTAEGGSLEGLLVAWLNELIFQFDTYGMTAKSITVTALEDYRITAILSGEEFDPARHEGRLLIKAATYHKVKVEKKDDQWEAEVIFDI